MDPKVVQELLSCSSSWLDVARQLQVVSSGSQVGKLMFGWAWQGVRAERILKEIEAAAEVMVAGPVTEATFTAYRAKCWEGINQVDPDTSTLPGLRSITASHRGVTALPSVVSSPFCLMLCW